MSDLPVIRVTVEDTETGEKSSHDMTDDVVVITAGRHYVDGVVAHANGTQVYTIKVDRS